MLVRELRVSYVPRLVAGDEAMPDRIVGPGDAGRAFMRLLDHESVEVGGVLCLATRGQVLAYHELARGTTEAVSMHPRELFKVALLANATAVVIAHNHPSGDPTPSAADIACTRRLAHAGTFIGIEVVDHVIVGHGRYVSMRESGHL